MSAAYRNSGGVFRPHDRQMRNFARRLSRANRELGDRETRLRALFDAEPDGVALVARDGTFVDVNHTGLRLLEAESLARLSGRRFDSFVLLNPGLPVTGPSA